MLDTCTPMMSVAFQVSMWFDHHISCCALHSLCNLSSLSSVYLSPSQPPMILPFFHLWRSFLLIKSVLVSSLSCHCWWSNVSTVMLTVEEEGESDVDTMSLHLLSLLSFIVMETRFFTLLGTNSLSHSLSGVVCCRIITAMLERLSSELCLKCI